MSDVDEVLRELQVGTCEACPSPARPAVMVRAVAGVAYAAAYCQECHDLGIMPLWIAVTNTVLAGGRENCVDWWNAIVERTIARHGIDLEAFDILVRRGMEEE